jgi:transketolase
LIVDQARKNGAVVTAEDHNIIGGLGDAVLEVLSDNDVSVPIRRIGVRDTFAETGSLQELYFKYGLSAQHIQNTVKSLLK